jgi:hypothetical protein
MPTWNLVRLELAGTSEYPEGSASRAYMLRVPLDDAGLIDEAALAKRPALATVRRFWPNEADQTGHLVRNRAGWAFSYAIGDAGEEALCHLDDHPLRLGDRVMLTRPDGSRVPFRVARSHADGVAAI